MILKQPDAIKFLAYHKDLYTLLEKNQGMNVKVQANKGRLEKVY